MDNEAVAIGKTKKDSLWTKDFSMTTISNLFLFFSFQMLIPTLPAYTEKLGGDQLAVGLVVGLFTLSALLTRVFVGKALDVFNKRIILILGLGIFAASVFSYNWMTTVLMVLSLRFIHGIGWGITTTSFGTIISDIIPSSRRGEGMGYYGLSSTLAMALAPVAGIWLMNNKGFSTLFIVSAILAVITIILTQTISFEKKVRRSEIKSSFWEGIVEKKALFPSLLIFFFAVSYGGVVTFITLFGEEVGIANVGWFFFGNALMVMVSRPIAGRIFDKKGHQWVLYPGGIFVILGLFLLSITTNTTMLLISALFFGLGFGTVQPSLQAWTINRVKPNRRGAANATFFSAFDLGIGLGSLILGVVAKFTSYAMMYRISILLIVFYYISYIWYVNKNKQAA